ITENADIKNALTAVLFGAVGTCGQRCTTTRRLIIHESVYDEVKTKLVNAYKQLSIGNPLDEHNHVGPLIDKAAVESYKSAIEKVKAQGGKFVVEGGIIEGEGYESGCYIKPCVAEMPSQTEIVKQE